MLQHRDFLIRDFNKYISHVEVCIYFFGTLFVYIYIYIYVCIIVYFPVLVCITQDYRAVSYIIVYYPIFVCISVN